MTYLKTILRDHIPLFAVFMLIIFLPDFPAYKLIKFLFTAYVIFIFCIISLAHYSFSKALKKENGLKFKQPIKTAPFHVTAFHLMENTLFWCVLMTGFAIYSHHYYFSIMFFLMGIFLGLIQINAYELRKNIKKSE